ncbi:MAG: tRNA(Ile)-lysidine synthase [Parcubacteria group bacterium GW2011_GWD2_38_11]|nr:MAG: tRNA(Ile)-lysidine synthase [Parcubacteria group bacterium GW2011_GWD2_38_11]
MAQFIKTIQNFAFVNNLWEKNSKIIIGVSGGSDSACLLDILAKLKPKYKFELHIVHINYALRGEYSQKDEIFVKELSKKYNIPSTVFKPKKADYKGNLENNLREIRYAFFEKMRLELGFDLVAVAHNQDDQAETVLMRIMRGSGLSGLSAMKAKTKKIIRPLLQTSKKDILAYVKENKLKYRTDKSNSDTKFTRNNIRHKLLPYLEKNFNPTIKKTLSDWSQSVADDYAFIEQEAQCFVGLVCKNKYAHFSVKEFEQLHMSIQRQVLRNVTQQLKNTAKDVESKQIEEMIKLIKSVKSKDQKALICGLNISKKGGKVDIRC